MEDEVSDLNKRVAQLYQAGKFAEALPVARNALKLSETGLGSNNLQTAAALNNLAALYEAMGDYAKPEELFQRALNIEEKAFGPNHPRTAFALTNMASLYFYKGEYAKAEPFYQRALRIDEKELDADHPQTAGLLNDLATLYVSKGDYTQAEPLYQRALKIRERALGPDHPSTATVASNLALLYKTKGKYAKAEPLYQRALKIYEKKLAPDHPLTGTTLNDLAELYRAMGDYAKAEPLYQRALRIDEKALGLEHADTAKVLNNLALLYEATGDYAGAEPLHLRALQIYEKALGPDHPDTATAVKNVATLYYLKGDHVKAEALFRRVLVIREKTLGPDHADTGSAINSLAELYEFMGDYAKAEPLHQRALKIYEKALGPDHRDTAAMLISLAALHKAIGDYDKAEPLYERALKISEKALGPDHPETATALNNLALFYTEKNDYAKAEPLQERVLKIREKVLGPDHPRTATALINLAVLYRFRRDYPRAEPLYQRALKIRERALGPDHPETATALINLAALYHSMGDYAKAEPLYRRALELCERTLGPDYPRTATVLYDLAALEIDLDNLKDAAPLVARLRSAREKLLANILSFTSEAQRLQFRKITDPYSLPATLEDAGALAQDALRQKGIVLDSLLEDRLIAQASADPKQREIVEQIRAAKQRLMQLALEIPKDLLKAAQKKRTGEKEKLFDEVERLEAELARQVTAFGKARRALSVTVAQIQSVLPSKATLVELLRYHHHGKNKSELRYGAVVIAPSGEPKWVPLGSAAEIEREVKRYQKSARGEADEATLSTVFKTLEERVWMPIEKALPPGTATIIVSPDAELSFVSFATLLTADDRFVGEKYSIRYVASGRDLLRETKTVSSEKRSMRLFANPDFAAKGTLVVSVNGKNTSVALRSIEMRDFQSIPLQDLPWTAKEAAELEIRAKRSGWQVQANFGLDATEAELRKIESPRVLHLATHGFFLPEIEIRPPNLTGDEIPKGKIVNPMHRSGIAMTGAQTTLEAWGRGEVPPTENDGIVTAEEVGGLKLDGTWLVVLSACDTGSGEARAGEGVMGLRRGFIQAGAQNLLMTLWPINDQTTVQIMLDFYEAAEKTKNAPQALADVQRDWLVKLRKERGLLDAVRLAGPFIMTSQGKP